MKKTMKIVAIVALVLMITMISTNVFAVDYQNIINSVDNTAKNTTSNGTVNEMAGKIIALIRNVAVVAGVILLSVIGIKFMLGSAEEKAEYKKSLIPLVVGIIVVMAATQIISMIFGFFA